jgi:hypothetical protein
MYFFDAEQLGRSAYFVCRLGPTHAVKLFGFVSESTASRFVNHCKSLSSHQRGLFLRQNQGLMSAMAMFRQLSSTAGERTGLGGATYP